MKAVYCFLLFLFSISIFGCVTLNPVKTTKNGEVTNYKYSIVPQTNSLSSGTGMTIGTNYFSSNKSVNPSDVISGMLSKNGLIKLPEIKPELVSQTVLVSYGESGRRSTGLGGYTIEVTIQFIDAETNKLISSCTAEGQGETEADDIRMAINRCLSSLLAK